VQFFTLATTSASGSAVSFSDLLLAGVSWLALIFGVRYWFRTRKNRMAAARAIANGSEWPNGVSAEFVGGMNIPSPYHWRAYATRPMARLTISDHALRMCARFGISAVVPGYAFEVPLDQIACAFTVRRTFNSHDGVGLKLSDGQFAYFWTATDTTGIILAVLRRRGVCIDPAQYKAPALHGELGRALDRGRGAAPTFLPDERGSAPL
jgi:hypothetical protein